MLLLYNIIIPEARHWISIFINLLMVLKNSDVNKQSKILYMSLFFYQSNNFPIIGTCSFYLDFALFRHVYIESC